MALVDAALHGLGRLRQLDTRVHAHGLFGVVGGQRQHLAAVGAADFKHIGEVVLALRVVVGHAGKRVEKRRRVEAIEAGVAFRDRGLLGRGVFLLDDARHRVALAHDAAVAEGVFHLHGEHHHGGIRLFALGDESGDRLGGDQGAVARKHHERAFGDRSVVASHGLASGVDGIACAQLLRLDDNLRVVLHERRDALAHVAQDGNDVGDARLAGGIHHPAHERLAQNLVGNLGFIGFHTGAGTRCKNQSFGVHARTFFASAIKTCEV